MTRSAFMRLRNKFGDDVAMTMAKHAGICLAVIQLWSTYKGA